MEKLHFVHPTGNANARAATVGLLEAGILGTFHTAIASFKGSWIDNLSLLPGLQELRRRRFHEALRDRTRIWPLREMARLLASRTGLKSLIQHETGVFCIDAVYRSLDRRAARSLSPGETSGIYAYEDGALAAFTRARELGMTCFYDLPIGYWRTARRLLEAERLRWPDWVPTLTGLLDSHEKTCRKDTELGLADRIFVASSFTRQTLADYPGVLAPIEVIPYGFPKVTPASDNERRRPGNSPLKLLFVGGLSQRKGIADLFAAVENIGRQHVHLTVVGGRPVDECEALNDALARHNWIPSLPHEQILKIMGEHDVLVFPSLFEGFGLVITEAMSQGTPVITTDRTAGPDLIEHGRNGWLIGAGETAGLQAQIEELLHRPDQIITAGREAKETARCRPWEVYGRELAESVARAFNGGR